MKIIFLFLTLTPFIALSAPLPIDVHTLEQEHLTRQHEESSELTEEHCRWPFEQLEVKQAQNLIEFEKKMLPGEGIRIAHIDTGIVPFPNFFNSVGGLLGLYMPRGKDGQDSFNYVEPHLLPIDNNPHGLNFGHGTETASLLIGRARWPSDSKHTFEGIVPWAQLIPIKVTDSVVMVGNVSTHGTADAKNLALGIRKAVSLNASVLTISLGAIFDGKGSIKTAIETALAEGAIVVAAAGQTLPINFLPLPANIPGVVSVTASTEEREVWNDAFSSKKISWAAPGVLVCHLGVQTSSDSNATRTISRTKMMTRSGAQVDLNGVIKRSSGTSYSVAFTSAAAALWLQYHNHASLKMLYGSKNISNLFMAVARKFAMETPPHWNSQKHGAGIINIHKLLRAQLPCSLADTQDSCAVKLEEFLKSTSR